MLLLALELVAPGAFMMWLGLAAVLVGVISLLIDWSWQWQCVAFAVFALASVPLWRRFARQVEPQSESPMLNRRTEALVGRVFTLERPIVDGTGTCELTTRSGGFTGRIVPPAAGSGSRRPTARALGSSRRPDRRQMARF